MAIQGHSRSFVSWPVRAIYYHIKILALSSNSDRTLHKITVFDHSTIIMSFDALSTRNPREYPHHPHIATNYSALIACQHSNFYGGSRKERVFCSRVRNGH